jgi:ABC-type phosphate transport system substrate-binding protein
MKRHVLAGLFLALVVYNRDTVAANPDVVVVVNKANPVHSLTRDELRPMFQTVKTQWPDGARIAPYNLPDVDGTRRTFDAAVLELDPDRVARYWIDRKIRGGERPPVKMPTAAAIVRAVAATAGGIGYVPEGELNATVKIVARIRGERVLAP